MMNNSVIFRLIARNLPNTTYTSHYVCRIHVITCLQCQAWRVVLRAGAVAPGGHLERRYFDSSNVLNCDIYFRCIKRRTTVPCTCSYKVILQLTGAGEGQPSTASLWSPYGIGQTVIFFALWFLLLSSFSPRLISAVAYWMSAILPHMV